MQTTLTNRYGLASVRSFAGSLRETLPGKLALGVAATLVIALAAHISFPLWFTPVPFTLQPLAVLGVGLAFGPVGGFLTLVAYLAEGACGLPVFTPTGLGGVAQLLGPTGGYLFAYPFVAALAGGLSRTFARRLSLFMAAALACGLATLLLFLAGALWFGLSVPAPLSVRTIWLETIAPFLPGETIKVLAAAGIYSAFARRHHN